MNPTHEPTPEQLAAYFDNELPPSQREAVEGWLVHNPEGRAEFDSLRQLDDLFRREPIPEPSPAAWQATGQRIAEDLERRHKPSRSGLAGWFFGTVAASIIALVLFGQSWVPEDTTPFPVVSPDEVRILSMNPNDHAGLVGVRSLLLEEIDLATHNEIEILGGNNDGVLRIDDWATPMLVDPRSVGGPR